MGDPESKLVRGSGGVPPGKGIENVAPDTLVRLG